MTTQKLDPVLTVVDLVLAARDRGAEQLRGARCPVCFVRTRYQLAHAHVSHAAA